MTAQSWRVGGFLHLINGLNPAQVQVFDLPLKRREKASVVSTQQFVQVSEQFSFTPATCLHLQAVDFRITQPAQVFCFCHPPGFVAVNCAMLSLHEDEGVGAGVWTVVGVGAGVWTGVGVGAGVWTGVGASLPQEHCPSEGKSLGAQVFISQGSQLWIPFDAHKFVQGLRPLPARFDLVALLRVPSAQEGGLASAAKLIRFASSRTDVIPADSIESMSSENVVPALLPYSARAELRGGTVTPSTASPL